MTTRDGTGPGTLYVVATPIGNLGDLSARASAVLREAGVIAAESPRNARPLLAQLGVTTRPVAYNDRNKARSQGRLLAALRAGRSVALISDAGTPGRVGPGAGPGGGGRRGGGAGRARAGGVGGDGAAVGGGGAHAHGAAAWLPAAQAGRATGAAGIAGGGRRAGPGVRVAAAGGGIAVGRRGGAARRLAGRRPRADQAARGDLARRPGRRRRALRVARRRGAARRVHAAHRAGGRGGVALVRGGRAVGAAGSEQHGGAEPAARRRWPWRPGRAGGGRRCIGCGRRASEDGAANSADGQNRILLRRHAAASVCGRSGPSTGGSMHLSLARQTREDGGGASSVAREAPQ